jgi:hypothetical protein
MASAATFVVCLALASCSSFSNTVSDNWPTWAGGMPKDVPPRPGAPGYDEFIAHQQGNSAAAAQGAAGAPVATNTLPPPNAAAAPATAVVQQPMPAPAASPNMQGNVQGTLAPRRDDQAAVQGGLY